MRVVASLLIVSLAIVTGIYSYQRDLAAQSRNMVDAPSFEVDPFWPKPLPNHWLLGSTIGVDVDGRDHVWIIHRSSATLNNNERGLELAPPTGECCKGAPPVLEFDATGNLVSSWGGPGQGYEWPASNHGITVDHQGNVWIGGNGAEDSQVVKFDRSGRFLMQVGKSGARRGASNAEGTPTFAGNSNDAVSFGRVAKIFVDPRENEAYLGDGYLNRRVAVIDADTGRLKRYWGAYGNRPDDADPGPFNPSAPPGQQFRNPVHCADMSVDRLVYVCDRQGNRLQVFRPDGTYVKEAFVARNSLGEGAVWDIAFSQDPQQRFIYLADGRNMKVRVLLRETLEELTNFGDGGRQPGQFFGVHSIATDSRGNLYTTETYEGKRVQRFVYKGMRRVPRGAQGVAWPR
jgi:DNA-binding beta-propeller fold protein YncE